MTLEFNSRRSTVHSTKGIACSTQPLASAVGAEILKSGGNAADAAVAMAAAMGVVEPMMTGIGGDVFCLYYDKAKNEVTGLNGSGKSAAAASLEGARAVAGQGNHVPLQSGYSVTVPGAPAGWNDILKRYGTMDLATVLEPAARLAEEGFPVSEICANMWKKAEKNLIKTSNGGDGLLIEGKAPSTGQLWTNMSLAGVYRKLAKEGPNGFYKGKVAAEIVAAVKRGGGVLSLEDLAAHKSLILEPITMPVNDEVTLHELPPNNHGLVALIAMGIINELIKSGAVSSSPKHNSAEYVHVLTEALKFGFKDADHYIGDPDEADFELKHLLSPEFIKSRAKMFSPGRVNEEYEHGVIDPENKSDTSYFTVADKQGNACSIIASVYHSFGSCIVPENTGFPLHNRACNFNLRDGARNVYGPSKRPYHTIIPAMLTRKDSLYASYGVMGAFMQPQGHVQVALNMLWFGMDAQQAIDAPRICIAPSPDDGTIPSTNKIIVYLEDGVDESVANELRDLGHTVKTLRSYQRSIFGRGQVIRYEPQDGRLVYHAGSDPRGDGCAIPEV